MILFPDDISNILCTYLKTIISQIEHYLHKHFQPILRHNCNEIVHYNKNHSRELRKLIHDSIMCHVRAGTLN